MKPKTLGDLFVCNRNYATLFLDKKHFLFLTKTNFLNEKQVEIELHEIVRYDENGIEETNFIEKLSRTFQTTDLVEDLSLDKIKKIVSYTLL